MNTSSDASDRQIDERISANREEMVNSKSETKTQLSSDCSIDELKQRTNTANLKTVTSNI